MARTLKRLRRAVIPGFLQLLPPLHRCLLGDLTPPHQSLLQGGTMAFWRPRESHFPLHEGSLYVSTSTVPLDARYAYDTGD